MRSGDHRGRAVGLALLGALGLLSAALVGRMLLGARSELRAAAAAHAAADAGAERLHLRRAMAYYLPGNPWVRRAADQLRERAEAAERSGTPREALAAWRALRGAVLALRGAHQPFAGELERANQRIAALTARLPEAAPSLRGTRGKAAQLRRLERPEEPQRGWTAVALAGFVLLLVGSLSLIFRGLSAELQPLGRRFWPLAALVALGLVLFFTGLARARPASRDWRVNGSNGPTRRSTPPEPCGMLRPP